MILPDQHAPPLGEAGSVRVGHGLRLVDDRCTAHHAARSDSLRAKQQLEAARAPPVGVARSSRSGVISAWKWRSGRIGLPRRCPRYAFVSRPLDVIFAGGAVNGSVAVVTLELAKLLAETYDVTVYASRRRGQATVEEFSPHLRVRRIRGALRKAHRYLRVPGSILQAVPSHFLSRGFFLEYYALIALELARHRPDVVHVQHHPQIGPLLRRLCPSAKLVLHLHSDVIARAPPRVARRFLAPFQVIATCSQYVTSEIANALPDLAARLFTVGNGVDLRGFPLSERTTDADNRTKLLYVGRLSPEKGPHLLLDAFNRVAERRRSTSLDLIGSAGTFSFSAIKPFGGDPGGASLVEFYGRTALERLRRELTNFGDFYLRHLRSVQTPTGAAATRFLGGMSHGETLRHYATADLLVVPSVLESFGMPIVEAMAAGLPVVATRAGGIPEIVEHGRTGLLVSRNDPKAMAESIMALLDDPDQRRAMGRAGRARVESYFTWDHVVRRLSAALA